MAESPDPNPAAADGEPTRREFVTASGVAMTCGLVASYGTLVAMAGRYLYLYPTGAKTKAWLYVTELAGMRPGESLE